MGRSASVPYRPSRLDQVRPEEPGEFHLDLRELERPADEAPRLVDRARRAAPPRESLISWTRVSNARAAESGTPPPSTQAPAAVRSMWKIARSAAKRTCSASITTTRSTNS